jgi:hypothetical protein
MRNRPFVATCFLGILHLASCGSGGSAAADLSDLALVSHLPVNGESTVPRNGVIRLVFSETVLAESVDDQAILVRTGGNFQTRPEGSFLVTGNVVEFDPTVREGGDGNATGFGGGEQIAVKVPLKMAGDGLADEQFLRSIEGSPITAASGGESFSFVTGAGWIDRTPGPPEIVGLELSPVPDQQGRVTSGATVTVVFNEAVDPNSFALGKNVFLTNNTPTAAESVYQKDIPSLVFYDGSLTRYTLAPVFGFGQGPYTIRVGFVDPDADTFLIDNPPADLAGNKLSNSLFAQDFDTLLDSNAPVYGVITEDFLTTANRDQPLTDALWGNDPQFPQELVGQPVTKRIQRVNVAAITGISGGLTAIDHAPLGTTGEEDYCPTQNPLVGSDSIIANGNPPASAGRRQLNLYRKAELGARGTIVRVAWGPDSDATFAASYPGVIMRLGHKRPGTNLSTATMSSHYDVDGFVTVVNGKDYSVPQAFDVNGGATNDGYLDWPALDLFFEYDGESDLIVDVEAQMGNTFQTFRTFLALSWSGVPSTICSCFNFANCLVNNSIGARQMDGVYGGNDANPAQGGAFAVVNPAPIVHVMEFEFAKLKSDARSIYRDTGVASPDYISPIVRPLTQAGGASVAFSWSASSDGIVEDVPFTSSINACDGYRYIRWHAALRSNPFTLARARLEIIQIPYLIP